MTLPRCSDVHVEPLPGSAKQGSVFVCFEHPGGWSRDVLDGGTFGPELTARLKSALKGRAGLQLIRRPGREGRRVERPHLFIVHAQSATTELLRVDGPEAILDLDLETPMANGGTAVTEPLLLVCTHGKRDLCCAVKGLPLAATLRDGPLGHSVWETSHTKGHRFAPALMLLPWAYSYGQLNEPAAASLLEHAHAGDFFHPGNRGRGVFDSAGQVAELAVAQRLLEAGERLHFGDLTATGGQVSHIDGRCWTVDMERAYVEGAIASCGKAPKAAKVLVARSVEQTG